jgi:hypothetical protein
LNLFPLRSFETNNDRLNAKYLGQLATRLYMALLCIGLSILAFYTIIQPSLLTKTFVKPSIDIFKRLMKDHSDTLICPCSSISTPYDRFVQIEPSFHPVRREMYPSNDSNIFFLFEILDLF